MNSTAIIAIAIFTISLFFTSIETANAQVMGGIVSEFCNAVARGLAQGPQSGMCTNNLQAQQSGNTALGNGQPCLPQFQITGLCQPNSSTGSTTGSNGLSCPNGILSECTTAPTCPAGTSLSGNVCVTTGSNPLPTCPTGTTLQGSTCVITACPTGQVLTNNVCVVQPTPPIASAGQNETVVGGSTVTLIGSASRATTTSATIVSWQWTQKTEPFVTLSPNQNTANPSFIAPNFATTSPLTFSLVVTDSNGMVSQPSTVVITITNSTR